MAFQINFVLFFAFVFEFGALCLGQKQAAINLQLSVQVLRLRSVIMNEIEVARPFQLGILHARNSPDNPCRRRAFAQRRLVAMARRGLSLPIHLCFVTDLFDKRLHISVILINNDPNNPRQTFVHHRGLFFLKAFVEHFYQSLTRDESLQPWGDHGRFSHPVAGAKASRQPLSASIVTGSRCRLTEKLFRFGHFGIPFL